MQANRELRVFISSTFRDLHEERDVLVRKVFPEIRAMCRQRGVVFTEVDLRWGLTDEDVALGQTIRTCLEEIDRCRPYFIGITGETYGYSPALHEIYMDPLLLARYPWVEQAVAEGASILELEFRHGALNNPSAAGHSVAFFFRRNEVAPSNQDDYARLEDLKKRVCGAALPVQTFREAGTLAELVRDYLLRIIEQDFSAIGPMTVLEQLQREQDAFAQSRRQAYIPNGAYIRCLDEHLTSEGPPLVIHGESGSGKSALVAYWAERLRHSNPTLFVVEHYVGIGAARATPSDIVRHILLEIQERYGVEPEQKLYADTGVDTRQIVQRLSSWFAEVQKEKMVLILDGVNQMDPQDQTLSWLPAYFPPQIRCVLSTTNDQTLAIARERGWQYLPMQPLTVDERRAIIVRFLAEYHKALSRAHLERIATDPKCAHALFLRTVLEELRLFGIHEQLEEKLGEYLSTTDTHDLFQRVLERMEEDFGSHALRQVLTLIWASRTGMAEQELAELTRLSRLKISSLRAALEYHLIEQDGHLTFFHEYLRRAVEMRYLSDARAKHRVHRKLAEYFADQPMSARVCQELPWQWEQAGDTQQVVEFISDPMIVNEFAQQDNYYALLGYWVRSGQRHLMSKRYRDRLAVLSAAHPPSKVAETLVHLCVLCDIAGEYAFGKDVGRQAVSIYEQLLGTDHHQTITAYASLANLLISLGEYSEAESLCANILSYAERSDKLSAERKMSYINNFATLLAEQGRFAEAEQHLRQLLATQEKVSGETRILASVLHNLATIVECSARYDEAEQLYSRALQIRESVLGKEHPSTISTIINFANVKLEQCRFDDALNLYHRAAEATVRSLGASAYYLAVIKNNMGRIHRILGNYAEAKLLYHEALQIVERTFGADHPANAVILNNLANIFYTTGNFLEAEQLHRSVLTLREQSYGNPHPLIIQSLLNLAHVYLAQGRIQDATALRERISAAMSAGLVLDSETMMELQCLDARIALQCGDINGAESLLAQLSPTVTAHSITNGVLELCGDLALVCNKTAAALEYYHKAISILCSLNPTHPLVASIQEKVQRIEQQQSCNNT